MSFFRNAISNFFQKLLFRFLFTMPVRICQIPEDLSRNLANSTNLHSGRQILSQNSSLKNPEKPVPKNFTIKLGPVCVFFLAF
jgi:hypothetical protein